MRCWLSPLGQSPLEPAIASLGLVLLAVAGIACGDNERMPFHGQERGPLPVGVTTVNLVDEDRCNTFTNECPRRFAVEIWYPATDVAHDLSLDVIDLVADMPPTMREGLGDFVIPTPQQLAVRDAPPRAGRRYPLVLFSHGDAALRYQSYTFCSYLASHGYVVVAPDHAGNTIFEVPTLDELDLERAQNAVNRPRDVTFVLDRIERDELTGGRVESIIDVDRIAMSGHSFGGLTSLLVTNPLTGFFDRRVSLAIPLAPATTALADLGAPIEINVAPTFYITGDEDLVTPLEYEVRPGYQQQTSDRGLAVLTNVGHLGFTDFCMPEIAEATRILGYPSYFANVEWDGCGDNFLDPVITQEHAAYFALAWLDQFFGERDLRAELGAPPFEGATVELALE